MKGRDCFRHSEADQVCELLKKLRKAEGSEQKRIRDRLREIGFYISDCDQAGDGFTTTDFDEILKRGLVRVCDDHYLCGREVGRDHRLASSVAAG